ncbi:MAG: hypothetical protein L6404_04775 [Candidatus Omnitrophica bacterium]|nr:hypothetical protein [Candidatus Omnitrophota bacterium]
MFPKRIFCFMTALALIANSSWLSFGYAQTTVFDLGQVVVSEDEDTKEKLTIEEKTKISQKTLKSHKVVDLAEILSDEMIEASMVRKSGYGNEVGLRGFTKTGLC